MNEKQRTIKKEFKLSGVGLHTGSRVNLTFKSAGENEGIKFIRMDLPSRPSVPANVTSIYPDQRVSRCTTIGRDEQLIYTVEHLMSVLYGLKIDNLIVEIDSNELPGLDGSGLEFLKAIQAAGIMEQDAPRQVFEIKEPLFYQDDHAAIFATPYPGFKVTYTLDYPHPLLRSQFFDSEIDPAIFETEIAPCRTFCLEREAQELQERGLGKGADYRNTLVVGEKGVIENTLRFKDEFARHKVLDLIGDLYLLGMPIRGHIYAIKSGHRLNIELLRRIHHQKIQYEQQGFVPQNDWGDKKQYDIQDIMRILPHRYPFLLIDRVIEIERGKKAIGIKNVTINDNFFQGHFPTKPVMPGVLMVEAMAQTAGVIVLTGPDHHGKVAFFMSADNVKFRKFVVPGDQLVMEVEIVNDKSRSAKVKAQAKVGDDLVAEAEMLFSYADVAFLS